MNSVSYPRLCEQSLAFPVRSAKPAPILRAATAADVDALCEIERRAFEYPWSRREFEFCVEAPRYTGVIVAEGSEPLGYAFYEKRARSYRLLSCAVVESRRREGLGTRLLAAVADALDEGRPEISCVVREGNVPAQLFLRNFGFRALWTVKGYYRATREEAYRMSYTREELRLSADCVRQRLLAR
ncbi:MAG: GNAT family N-acetyltransferase [Thermoguttaceae bacterium]|nr:GNAT family N-acetyltransferase [Thermoguttaceae bacterium]